VIAAAPHGPDGGPVYPGTCRGLTEAERAARADQPHALRLDMTRALIPGLTFEEEGEGIIAADPARFGDVVLARKDTPTSYHLCVTHDDALQGVTLVTRGRDLQQATHLHSLLQALMGWPTPVYAHHRLLTDAAGRRLAKRDRAVTVRALRAAGVTAAAIRDHLLAGSVDTVATWIARVAG
jgi:glutamyl-Q tRNA(Asp) synthetase